MRQTRRMIFLIAICMATIVSIALATSTSQEMALPDTEPSETIKVSVAMPTPALTPTAATEPVATPSPTPEPPEYIPDPAEVEMLAKLTYGEARGIFSQTEQAAVMWCVLNRVDAEGYAMGHSIKYVVTFKGQIHGYDPDNPTVDDYGRDLTVLAADVLTRWATGADGRVLPVEYLWFEGDGEHNYFRDAYRDGNVWYWSLPSPYDS